MLILGAGPAGASEAFNDVTAREYSASLDALVDLGVLAGCTETEFCPDEDLSRAQMATVLANALDLPPAEENFFEDALDTTHEQGINRLAEAELTRGCDEGLYCPDEVVTRGQFATLLVRGFEIPETDVRHFDDDDGYHGDAINRLAEVGIAAGCGDSLTAFCAGDPVLRWQAVLFLSRALDIAERVELAPLEERRELQAEIDAERERAAEERRAEERRAEEQAARYAIWDAMADCESHGRWDLDAGQHLDPYSDKRYYGGLQFNKSSWDWARDQGGHQVPDWPHHATREQQIEVAETLLAIHPRGWGAWPDCSRIIGVR